jgi:hypothetical protein
MYDSVFCGKIEINSYVDKCGHFSTTGTSLDGVQEYLENSYYKYHKVVGASVGEMISSIVTTKTFDAAYIDYMANNSAKAFVSGKWDNIVYWDYYYCAPPTVARICHRNLNMASPTDEGPVSFKYCVKKNGGSAGTAEHLAWAIEPSSASATADVVSFSDVGIENNISVSYTIPTGYEVRYFEQETKGKVSTLTIILDFKVEVVVMDPYLNGTTTQLESGEYTKTETQSIGRIYPDLIDFTYNKESSSMVLTYAKTNQTIILSFNTNPNPFFWTTWKVGTTAGSNLANSGNCGDYRSKAILVGNNFVLRIYPMAELKTYDITIK